MNESATHSMQSEKERAAVRISVDIPAYIETSHQKIECRILDVGYNISGTGAAILIPNFAPLRIGEKVNLVFDLPPDSVAYTAKGRVVYVIQDVDNAKMNRIGIKFLRSSMKNKVHIIIFLLLVICTISGILGWIIDDQHISGIVAIVVGLATTLWSIEIWKSKPLAERDSEAQLAIMLWSTEIWRWRNR